MVSPRKLVPKAKPHLSAPVHCTADRRLLAPPVQHGVEMKGDWFVSLQARADVLYRAGLRYSAGVTWAATAVPARLQTLARALQKLHSRAQGPFKAGAG